MVSYSNGTESTIIQSSYTSTNNTSPSITAVVTSVTAAPEIINTSGVNQLVHIGFQNDLSYQKVFAYQLSNSIFDFLDVAVSKSLQTSNVTALRIWARKRRDWLGGDYQAIVDMTIPSADVQQLQDLILNKNSALYNNQSEKITTNYAKLIDSTVSLTGSLNDGYNESLDRRGAIAIIMAIVFGTLGVCILLGISSFFYLRINSIRLDQIASGEDSISSNEERSQLKGGRSFYHISTDLGKYPAHHLDDIPIGPPGDSATSNRFL